MERKKAKIMNARNIIFHRWRQYVLVVMVLLIPFYPKWLTPLIILNLIFCFMENPKAFSIKEIIHNKPFLFLILFYLYHIVGLFWTSNFSYAGLDGQLKLPLLLLPLTFLPGNGISTFQKHQLFSIFVYSLASAVLFCIIRAVWFYFSEGANYFLYKDFSYFIHPGYFSMFLCFGCALIFHKIVKLNSDFNSSIQIAGTLVLMALYVLGIILLASKSGIFVLLLLLAMFIGFSLLKLKRLKFQLAAFLFILIGSVLYFSFYSNVTSTRMVEMSNAVTTAPAAEVHSTGMRIQAWESTFELVKLNPVFGTGTGDIKDELVKMYDQKGFEEIFKLRLNAHNQFLQSFAALGIIGFMLLVLALMAATVNAFKSKNGLAAIFLIVVTLNMLTESILEVSAGSVFVAVFFAILFSNTSDHQHLKS